MVRELPDSLHGDLYIRERPGIPEVIIGCAFHHPAPLFHRQAGRRVSIEGVFMEMMRPHEALSDAPGKPGKPRSGGFEIGIQPDATAHGKRSHPLVIRSIQIARSRPCLLHVVNIQIPVIG
jgi:hypothetical protein